MTAPGPNPSAAIPAPDAHAGALESVVARILESAAALQRADPRAVPLACWDFDGTLLEGDCIDGYRRSDGTGYTGLVERAILAGLCPGYEGAEGAARCEHEFLELLRTRGKPAAYTFQTLLFAGMPAAPLRHLAQQAFDLELGGWLYAEARAAWHRLEAAGVQCWVLSASPDFFVKAAACHLGVPDARCLGMRPRLQPDGTIDTSLEGPVMVGEGKTARLRSLITELAAEQPEHSFHPVAAFGNDPISDGPMIDAVRESTLPGGRPVGVLVNSRTPAPDAHGGGPLTIALAQRRIS